MNFPAPPKLKTTIIQLNKDIDPEDNNYEVLSNDYASDSNRNSSISFSNNGTEDQPRKKRRRSSATIGEEELAKRRTETKQLHSLIEKRRRIKINREFEALKYLIPACRSAENGTRKPVVATNNANKIDGMYKLTILKTSVEYILYLHHIIQKQHALLSSTVNDYSFDVSFADIPLDVNQYRNIDQDFDFHEFAAKCASQTEGGSKRSAPMRTSLNSSSLSIAELEEEQEAVKSTAPGSLNSEFIAWKSASDPQLDQLPTPHITPEISPILTMLSKYKSEGKSGSNLATSMALADFLGETINSEFMKPITQDTGYVSKSFLFASPASHSGATSTSTSPFTIPIKTLVKKTMFTLPDPALSSTSTSIGYVTPEGKSMKSGSISPNQNYPRKMYFKSQVPPQNLIANVGLEEGGLETDGTEVDASKMLLALRKPSIDRLLN